MSPAAGGIEYVAARIGLGLGNSSSKPGGAVHCKPAADSANANTGLRRSRAASNVFRIREVYCDATETGDAAQIASFSRTSHTSRTIRGSIGPIPTSADDVSHTEKLLLVDEVGHVRGVYNGTLAHEVNRLVEDDRQLEGLKAKS